MASPTNIGGVIPPATTPFRADDAVALSAVRSQIEWYAKAGVNGVAVGGSTGEGHTLRRAEFERVLTAAVDAASGQMPVIAGIIVNDTSEAIARGEVAMRIGAAALQVTPPHYLFRPSDEALIEYFATISEQSVGPVIIYNVVPWCYLSPELLCQIFDEAPHVIGVKQSAGDLKLLADLIDMAPADRLILSAVDALMYPSYTLGAHGSIAAILAAAPHASVALWDAVEAGDHARARDLHGKLLKLWNAINGDNLPACVKFVQRQQGVTAGLPRRPMPPANALQRAAIAEAMEALDMPTKAG